MMVDFVLFIIGVGDEFFEFRDVFPSFAQIERPKIHVKWFILKILHWNMHLHCRC